MKTFVMILSAAVLVSACSVNAASTQDSLPGDSESDSAATAIVEPLEGDPEEQESTILPGVDEQPFLTSTGELEPQEAADLLFMREEEKLARDVYLQLFEMWDLPVFQNIAGSEGAHMEAVLTLLDRYGLQDPAAGLASGEFKDPSLQARYTELVAQGSLSLENALAVGALVEEMDIQDLKEAIVRSAQADIVRTYERLLNGSSNHLRAFTNMLASRTGEAYVPQYLELESYQAILEGASAGNGPAGRGGMTGPGRASGQRRGWGGKSS